MQRSALCRSRRELPTSIYLQNLFSIQPSSLFTCLFVPLRYLQFLRIVRFTSQPASRERAFRNLAKDANIEFLQICKKKKKPDQTVKILGPLRARAGAHGAGVAGLAGGRALRRPRRLRRRPAAPPPRAPLGEVRLPSLEFSSSNSLINLDYAKNEMADSNRFLDEFLPNGRTLKKSLPV